MLESLSQCEEYLATFIAAMVGGELLILPIIIGAKLGHINLVGSIGMAFCGMLTKDWLVFLVFRKFGRKIINWHPTIKKKMERVDVLFAENPHLVLYAYRLMFGLVNTIIITLAICKLPSRRFARISLVSNTLLILILGGLGYFFAEIMMAKIDWIHQHKVVVIGGFLLLISLCLFMKKSWDKMNV